MMMYCKKQLFFITLISVLLLGLSSCSSIDNLTNTKSNINYKHNSSVKSLDFPPDLTAPKFDYAFTLPADGVILASSVSRESLSASQRNASVLPDSTHVQIGTLGSSRWLDVNASATSLWPKIREFWSSIGIGIKRDEPHVGIIETEWAENAAELPMDFFRQLLGKMGQNGFDSGTRDRYRVRVEKTSVRTTRIFLTHQGAVKKFTNQGRGWGLESANKELEAELLNRLKAFLQGDSSSKKALLKSSIRQTSSLVNLVEQEGHVKLHIRDSYPRSWLLTGIMLDRMGLVVEDKNQSSGIYKVKYQGGDIDTTASQGYFSRLLNGRKPLLSLGGKYQVHVQDSGKISIIRVANKDGKPLVAKQSRVVLTRLKKEFDR